MTRFRLLRSAVLLAAVLLLPCVVAAADALAELPPAVQRALQRGQVPAEALSIWIAEADAPPDQAPRLALRAAEPLNPASLMKLYTTGVALELLGPAWTWTTPVHTDGPLADGVLQGDLAIQGRGDPTLVIERLWLLLRQVQQRGIREIRGDIVLDGGLFVLPQGEPGDPGEFDGERYRPYNVRAEALLLNLKSLTLGFIPDAAAGHARVTSDVALAGVQIDATVPLLAGDCGDWRGALGADFGDPARLRFTGGYPLACGEKSWPVAYADPRSYNARLVDALWRELGGRLGGRVRDGSVPASALPLFELPSAPLAAVVRDINKFSNNVMAQQLFLSLGQGLPLPVRPADAPPPTDTHEAARELLRVTLRQRIGCRDPELIVDNGSGLSRASRSSARCLGAWLQTMWAGPTMPELMSSLPVAGVDGTARRPGRAWGVAHGRAHLKTGSLRDALGLAGYVLGNSGRRYVFVALANHPNAGAARAAFDALLQWTVDDTERCCRR
jgi:D-alanyl-D-alanine carboxypeptidase/D-alanyl-D-alanine-endopeptidase (penicillin-binding protein 4)